MLIYLSGPMTGIPGENYPAFHTAAARLRELGYDVLNPAETAGGVTHLDRTTFLSIDVGYVQAADAIVSMEGWKASRGSKLEMILGASLDKPIFEYDPKLGVGSRIVLGTWGFEFQYVNWRAAMGQGTPVEAEETVPQIPAETEDGAKIIPLFSKTPTEVS